MTGKKWRNVRRTALGGTHKIGAGSMESYIISDVCREWPPSATTLSTAWSDGVEGTGDFWDWERVVVC